MSGSLTEEERCARAGELIRAERYADAVELLEELAEHSSVEAMSMYGTLLYLGLGGPSDGRKAEVLLLAAAPPCQ